MFPEEHRETFARTLRVQNDSATISSRKVPAENAGNDQANLCQTNLRILPGSLAPRLAPTFPIVRWFLSFGAGLSGLREEKVRTITGYSNRALIPPQSATDNWLGQSSLVELAMSKKSDAQIEKIIAACDGDVHGALRALMLVNEQLETELQELQAAVAYDLSLERRTNRSLH
jgi:hypothetical protein